MHYALTEAEIKIQPLSFTVARNKCAFTRHGSSKKLFICLYKWNLKLVDEILHLFYDGRGRGITKAG